MKKLILLFTAMAFVGCSGDDDNASSTSGTSFSYDNTSFNLPPVQGMIEQRMSNALTIESQTYNRSTITVTGSNGTTQMATVSFDLYYKTGTSIAGTYQIDDALDDMNVFEDFLASNDRACMGWTSMGTTISLNGGGAMDYANNPSGTVTITANSAANYTVSYEGNFKQYDSDFNLLGNVPCHVNVQADVTLQEAD